MKIVFFNGPPKSGKSTAAVMLANILRKRDCKRVYELAMIHLADEPKEMVHRAYEVDGEELMEEDKDASNGSFWGATPREAYVAFIQGLISMHGDAVLGEMLLRQVKHTNHKWLLVPDLGRLGDAAPLANHFGFYNCCIVRMHRKGCDYSADRTRSYVEKSGLREFDLINDGDESRLRSTLEAMVKEEQWFAKK